MSKFSKLLLARKATKEAEKEAQQREERSEEKIIEEFTRLLKEASSITTKKEAIQAGTVAAIIAVVAAIVAIFKDEILGIFGSSKTTIKGIPTRIKLTSGEGRITSEFGERAHPVTGKLAIHKGIDIAGKEGEFIYSYDDGVVTVSGAERDVAGNLSGYGYWVEIEHANGLRTRYAHMREKSPLKVGDRVKKGQFIGYVGTTGTSSGSHLHFEVRQKQQGAWRAINPAPYVASPIQDIPVVSASAERLSIPSATFGHRRMRETNNYGNVMYSSDIAKWFSQRGASNAIVNTGARFATFTDPAYGILAIAQRVNSYKNWDGTNAFRNWNTYASEKLPATAFAKGTLSIAKYSTIYAPFGDGSNNPEFRARAIASAINRYGGSATITTELNPSIQSHFYALIVVTLQHEGSASISSSYLEDLYMAYINKGAIPTEDFYRVQNSQSPSSFVESRTIRTHNESNNRK